MTSVEAMAKMARCFLTMRALGRSCGGVFRRLDNSDMIAFKGGTGEQSGYLFPETFAAEPLQRVAWYEEVFLAYPDSLPAPRFCSSP